MKNFSRKRHHDAGGGDGGGGAAVCGLRSQLPDRLSPERRGRHCLPLPGGRLRCQWVVQLHKPALRGRGGAAAGECGSEKENAELQRQLDQAKIDSEENQRLRNLLNLRQQRRDFTFESAIIVDRSTSNWSRVMTLNKGTSSGIAVGNCVVDDQGNLVGVIREAGLNWSTITTILDTDSSLGARVFRTGEVTVAMGDLALMETGRLKLSYLEGESSLINGDLIVTSGLGGYYPSQLVIGSVEEIRTDDNGLTRYAVLAPKTDLDSLSEVFVITSFDTVD